MGRLLGAFLRGKAALKAHIADTTDIDVTSLPYSEEVVALIEEARREGRPVHLASASNARYVGAVAEHLGLFDGWFGSDRTENLSSSVKARRLVAAFGEGGFDYIGNGAADFAVWGVARRRIAVQPSGAVTKRLLALAPDARILPARRGGFRDWVRLLRVHQWVKNALVFVPLLTAHRFDALSLISVLGAFLCFSVAASGIYLVNDLVDLEADRRHASKKARPLARGGISVLDAIAVAPLLVVAATAAAYAIAPLFAAVVAAYLVLTTLYTFLLKRKMMVDVVTLAVLYTLRVIGGAAVVGVPVSEWLLAFSMFMFTTLALIKRYTELTGRIDGNLPDIANRDYRKIDLDIVAALAAAAGFNAVTVFTLYVSSETVRQLYRHPQLLWLICPILMYWVGRMLLLAHRRKMDDDPILFAVKDRISLISVTLIGAIILLAT